MPTYDNARYGELVGAYLGLKALGGKQRARGGRVRAVAFNPRDTILCKATPYNPSDTTNDIEAIITGTESECRLMVGDASREDATLGDIRRVRGDDIKLHILKRFKEVADADIRTTLIETILANIF